MLIRSSVKKINITCLNNIILHTLFVYKEQSKGFHKGWAGGHRAPVSEETSPSPISFSFSQTNVKKDFLHSKIIFYIINITGMN
jgi:hypothetical protein